MNKNLTILVDFDHTLFDTGKFVKFRSKNPKELNYSDFLYPDAIPFIIYASGKGTTVLFSEGEVDFQKEKINGTGIEKLFNGGVRVLPSFSKMSSLKEWKGRKLVLIDDKPEVIKDAAKKSFLTIRVRRGRYVNVDTQNLADFTVKSLREIVDKNLLESI